MTVTNAEREEGVEGISATIDRDTFVEAVSASGTITLTYTTDWSADPATYGVTVTGTPISGDVITIVYVKENRGLITTANPTSFVSTGWNLYNHSVGYARVVNYSEEFGFMIDGTYTGLKFSETLNGEQTTITPVDGYFTVPADGYVFVTGGNSTDTMIWMTWSDWTEEPNGGVFAAYSQTSIDLTGVMTNFPDGLMRIGNAYDEINLNTLRAYSRIQKLEYTEENLENVIALGLPYDTDTNYIYAVRQAAVAYTISIDGEYSVSDHGMEIYLGTSIPVYSTSLYGNDLKGKLRRDVLTISQQTLSAAQKTQVQDNIGVTEQVAALNSKISKMPSVDLEDCSTLSTLFSLLRTGDNKMGYGGIGNSNNTNLRTLLGNPDLGAWVSCNIVMLSDNTTSGFAIAMCGSAVADGTVKFKFLKHNGNYYGQTSWS
jgi:hypothetical protein